MPDTRLLAVADEDDILVSIREDDLLDAIEFISATIKDFGPEDVAAFIGRSLEETTALAERLSATIAVIQAEGV